MLTGVPAQPLQGVPPWAPAGLGRRLGAAAIDVIVVAIIILAGTIALTSVVGVPQASEDPTSTHLLVYSGLAFAVLTFPWAGYFLIGWYRGQTPGMAAVGVRLVSINGGRPSAGQLLLRLAGAFWSTVPLFLGFFWVAFDRKGRAWHDMLSGTCVEERPRQYVQWSTTAPGPPYPLRYQYPAGYEIPPGYAEPPAEPAAPPPVAPPDETVVDEAVQRGWRSLTTLGRSPWTWTDVVPVISLFIPITWATGLLIVWVRQRVQPVAPTGWVRGVELLSIGVLVYTGVFILLFLLVFVRRHATLADLGLGKVSPRWLIAAIPALVGGYCLAGVAGAFSRALFPGTPNNQCTAIRDNFAGYVWVAIAVVVVAAPLVEELLLRGFLLRYLRDRIPVVAAILFSAAIFSALHLQWGQPTIFLPVFALGIVLGTLYVYSGTIWPGVIVHGSFNLISTLVLLSGIQHC